MKKCKKCQTDIDNKATKCPHCQSDQRNWFRKHPVLTFLGILFLTSQVINGMVNSSTSQISNNSNQKIESQIVEKQGKYLNYNYSIVKGNNSVYTATFNPFLSRKDATVTGAIFELINNIYGKHNVKDLSPKIIERNGKNLIQILGIKKDYYFLLIKEDNGEVNSLIFWEE